MKRGKIVLTVFLIIFLFTLQIIPIHADTDLIYSYNYHGVNYTFYSDKVVADYGNETITIYFNLLGDRLSRLFNFNYSISKSSLNTPIIIYEYSLNKKIGIIDFSFSIKHIFKYSTTGYMKISTEIDSNHKIPKLLGKLFSYIVVYNGDFQLDSNRHRIRGKHLIFGYSDMVIHRISFDKVFSKSNREFDLNIVSNGSNRVIIDPTVGVSEGEAVKQEIYVNATDNNPFYDDFERSDISPWVASGSGGADSYCSHSGSVTIDSNVYNISSHSLKTHAYAYADGGGAEDRSAYHTEYATYTLPNVLWGFNLSLWYKATASGDGTSEASVQIEMNGTWVEIESGLKDWTYVQVSYGSNTNLTAIRTKSYSYTHSVTQDSRTTDVYIDFVYINNPSYTYYNHYWAYSDANVTYQYNLTLPSDTNNAYITLPKGYDVKNISAYNLSTYQIYNSTSSSYINRNYKSPLKVDNSGNSNSLTDYQIKFTIPYDSDMQSDFSDLIFAYYNSTEDRYNLIPAWNETINSGSNATIWVKLPSISANTLYDYSNSTYFVFWGNETNVNPYWNKADTLEFSSGSYNPTDDAHTDSLYPDTNKGTENIYVGSGSNRFRTFLKFDLTSISLNVRDVSVGQLKLYCYDDGDTPSIEVHKITDDSWDEGTITYNNEPAMGSSLVSQTHSTGWITFTSTDLESYVLNELQDDEIISFELYTPDGTDGVYEGYYSKEYGSNIPELYIEVYGAKTTSPEPSTNVDLSYKQNPPSGDFVKLSAGEYSIYAFNSTYNVINLPSSTLANYDLSKDFVIYATSWNSIWELHTQTLSGTEATYFNHGQEVNVSAVVKDPYGNVVSGQNVTFGYNYSKWYDLSGNGNHGQIYGATISDNVSIGAANTSAVNFDGDDYVDSGNPPSLQLTHTGTVEALIKVHKLANSIIVGKNDGYNDKNGYVLWLLSSGQIRLKVCNDTGQDYVTSSDALAVDTWYYVAGVFDGSNLYVYINSVQEGTATQTRDAISDLYNLVIGRNARADETPYYLNASIAFVRIFSSALNSTIIKQDNDAIFYGNTTLYSDNTLVLDFENKFLIGSAFASSLTNSNGMANATLTLPSTDSVLFVWANTSGDYPGLKQKTIFSTSISYSWQFQYNPVHKGDNDKIQVNAKYTVDNSGINGYAYVNNTEISISNGYGELNLNTSLSGYYDYNLQNISDDLVSIYPNENKILEIAGLNYDYEENPSLYYKLPNQDINVSITVYYDSGLKQYQYPNNTLISLNFTWYGGYYYVEKNTSLGEVSQIINMGRNDSITVYITIYEIDDSTIVFHRTLYENTIELKDYSLAGDYADANAEFDIDVYTGILGSYKGGLYLLKPNISRYSEELNIAGDQNLMSIDYVEYNHTILSNIGTLQIKVMIINYNSSTRYFNSELKLYTPYSESISNATVSNIECFANNIAYLYFTLNINEAANNYYKTPIYMNLTVYDSYEKATVYKLTPLLIYPEYSNYSIVYYQGFDESTFTNKYRLIFNDLSLNSVLEPAEDNYIAISLENNIKLKNTFFEKIILPEDLQVPITILLDKDLAESGDSISIYIDFNSSYSFQGTLKIYIDQDLMYSSNVSVPGDKTVSFTIPQYPQNTWQTKRINVEIYWNNRLVGSNNTLLSIYNSGPLITLESPAEASVLNGTVTIDLAVSDSNGVSSVVWKWDFESAWHNISEPYDLQLDTKKYPNGMARLIVRAYDDHGFESEKYFYFTISNPETQAAFFQTWQQIGTLISRYAFLPAIAISVIVLFIGFAVGKAWSKRPQQPIIIRYQPEEKTEENKKRRRFGI